MKKIKKTKSIKPDIFLQHEALDRSFIGMENYLGALDQSTFIKGNEELLEQFHIVTYELVKMYHMIGERCTDEK